MLQTVTEERIRSLVVTTHAGLNNTIGPHDPPLFKYQLLGILSVKDMARSLIELMKSYDEAKILTTTTLEGLEEFPLPFVHEDAPVWNVFHKLRTGGVDCVVVGSNVNSIDGILTDSDVVGRMGDPDFEEMTAKDIMTTSMSFVTEKYSIMQALLFFARTGHRYLPIVEDKSMDSSECDIDLQSRLVGLVSIMDILRLIQKTLQ
jgi:CBS domain-containing protein